MTKTTPPPERSLAKLAPGLAAEWHPTLNVGLTPTVVTPGSSLKVYWLCAECGHAWQARIGSRVRGHGCPACARRRTGKARSLPATGESLAERIPELAAEWHPSLNGDLTPDKVRCKSNKKVWWLCPMCGHEWRTAVGNRANGAGCLPCSRKRRQRRLEAFPPQHPAVDASLAEQFPLIAAQWHPSRNGSRVPSEFRRGSNSRAWWLCPICGHEWEAIIISRTRGGAGCQPCGRRQAGAALAKPKPGRSLAEINPELAAQWHPTLNGDLTPSMVAAKSGKRAWWLCPSCGNEWDATIGSRADGSGCKACATEAAALAYSTPKVGQSLAECDSEIAAQWHPTRNGDRTAADVTVSSGRKAWWLCARGHEWEAMISNRSTKARGCPQCTLWGTSVEEIRLRHELLAAGVPIDTNYEIHHPVTGRVLMCDMIVPDWSIVVEFDGHRFHQIAESRVKDRKKTELLQEAGWTVIRVREALELVGPHDVVVPKFSSELVRAQAVLIKLRELGHQTEHLDRYLATEEAWASSAADDEVRRPRANSLALQSPALAAEWDAVKNAPLTPDHVTVSSGQKAWWLCPACGHGWRAAIYTRGRHGCPECGKLSSTKTRSLPKPGNSLTDRNSAIAAEWHPSRNGDQTPQITSFGSSKRVWWLCGTCAVEWQAVVNKRTNQSTRCPNRCPKNS